MTTFSKTIPKALSEAELRSYTDWIRERIQGAQLQDVRTDGHVLVLELYGLGPFLLIFDPKHAGLFLVNGNDYPGFKKVQKPLQLFLKSHAKNLALGDLALVENQGRVVEFLFVNRFKEVRLKYILIPHFVNLIANTEGKSIAWSKPKEIPDRPQEYHSTEQHLSETDWEAYGRLIFDAGPSEKKEIPLREDREKQISKKTGALEKLKATLSDELELRWLRFGESLKIHSTAPKEFADLWRSDLNLAENRERAFHKAKEARRKRAGTQERILILEKEISNLQNNSVSAVAPGARKGTQAMIKSGSKGQTLNLASGAQAIVGKSAKDNLAILRQARAWDLWVHLKDDPSSHGVIFRDKNQTIGDQEIQQVAQWVLAKSKLGKKDFGNFKFEVLVVECRFVKPIKGDKLGRVTYKNPKVYSFASKLTS